MDWRKDEAFVEWLKTRPNLWESERRVAYDAWLASKAHENERCARVCEKDAETEREQLRKDRDGIGCARDYLDEQYHKHLGLIRRLRDAVAFLLSAIKSGERVDKGHPTLAVIEETGRYIKALGLAGDPKGEGE